MEDSTPVKSNFSVTIHASIEDLEIDNETGIQQPGCETIAAPRTSDHSIIKRTYFPGIIDILEVTEPSEIRAISNDSRFDRDFIEHGPVHNVLRHRKMLRIFSLDGKDSNLCCRCANPSRAAAQDERQDRRSKTRPRSIGAPGRIGLSQYQLTLRSRPCRLGIRPADSHDRANWINTLVAPTLEMRPEEMWQCRT